VRRGILAAVAVAVVLGCACALASAPAAAQAATPPGSADPATAAIDPARVKPRFEGERLPPAASRPGAGLGRLPYDPRPTGVVPGPRRPAERRDRIVYAFDQPSRSLLTVSRELSAECRRGRFIQRIDMQYRAFGPGERPLGVAYGKWALNLVDPQRRRNPELVYFFDKQDTARCTVYTARMAEIRDWFVGP